MQQMCVGGPGWLPAHPPPPKRRRWGAGRGRGASVRLQLSPKRGDAAGVRGAVPGPAPAVGAPEWVRSPSHRLAPEGDIRGACRAYPGRTAVPAHTGAALSQRCPSAECFPTCEPGCLWLVTTVPRSVSCLWAQATELPKPQSPQSTKTPEGTELQKSQPLLTFGWACSHVTDGETEAHEGKSLPTSQVRFLEQHNQGCQASPGSGGH